MKMARPAMKRMIVLMSDFSHSFAAVVADAKEITEALVDCGKRDAAARFRRNITAATEARNALNAELMRQIEKGS
jgi:uncharacterized protein YukE